MQDTEEKEGEIMSDTDENRMSQDRIEHLKLVELVHTRLVGNSSQMKTWTVSIVTAAFIFLGLSDDLHWIIPAGGGIAVIAFCIMDIRYLYLQKGFIRLFRATADGETERPFEMNYKRHMSIDKKALFLFFTWSIAPFYVILLLVMLALASATYCEIFGDSILTPERCTWPFG